MRKRLVVYNHDNDILFDEVYQEITPDVIQVIRGDFVLIKRPNLALFCMFSSSVVALVETFEVE